MLRDRQRVDERPRSLASLRTSVLERLNSQIDHDQFDHEQIWLQLERVGRLEADQQQSVRSSLLDAYLSASERRQRALRSRESEEARAVSVQLLLARVKREEELDEDEDEDAAFRRLVERLQRSTCWLQQQQPQRQEATHDANECLSRWLSDRHRLLRHRSADLNEQLLLLLSEEEASRFSSRRERTVRTLATLHPSSASSTGACSTTWSTRAKCHFEWAGVSSQCIFSFHLSSLLLFLFVYSSCNLLLRLRRRLHRELRSGGRVPRPQWPVLQLQWRARANAFRLVGRLERFEYKKPVLPSQDYYE